MDKEEASPTTARGGRLFILVLVVVLFVAHQDQWYWTDDRLVFGFAPVGLVYHAVYSVLAAVVWFLASTFAWPHELEAFADGGDDEDSTKPEASE